MTLKRQNMDAQEVARFAAQSESWWDRKGSYKALHEINPVRVAYIKDRCVPAGKRVLDIGCGGGLLSEAMALAEAHVTGIDMAAASLAVARRHAEQGGLTIDYQQGTGEAWASMHPDVYDVVVCMELVEHVPDPGSLVQACSRLAAPGGDLFFATVNRTWLSRLLVIWLSEYVLGIVPKKTHTYDKFVRPEELVRWGRKAGLALQDVSGVSYLPYIGYAALSKHKMMNYLVHFKKE